MGCNISPAETFGDITIDYPDYVECTSAAIQALAMFKRLYLGHRRDEIERSIRKTAAFIESIQKEDGSWYGSWGMCYTYGTWFGITGLVVAAGKEHEKSWSIRKAVEFVLSKQFGCGGWGETYHSCQNKVYSTIGRAMLGLIASGQADRDPSPLHRAAKCLIQEICSPSTLSWRMEIIGLFNRNCMMSYSTYRGIFPIWALGLYHAHVLSSP